MLKPGLIGLTVLVMVLVVFAPAHQRAAASVTLDYFKAEWNATSHKVVISWKTATELNTTGFIVQRSTSPTIGFVDITGVIPAAGDQLTGRTYGPVTDTLTFTSGATYWYQLVVINSNAPNDYISPVAVVADPPTPTPTMTRTPTPTPTYTDAHAHECPLRWQCNQYFYAHAHCHPYSHPHADEGAFGDTPCIGHTDRVCAENSRHRSRFNRYTQCAAHERLGDAHRRECWPGYDRPNQCALDCRAGSGYSCRPHTQRRDAADGGSSHPVALGCAAHPRAD